MLMDNENELLQVSSSPSSVAELISSLIDKNKALVLKPSIPVFVGLGVSGVSLFSAIIAGFCFKWNAGFAGFLLLFAVSSLSLLGYAKVLEISPRILAYKNRAVIRQEFEEDLLQIRPENYTLDEAVGIIRSYYDVIDSLHDILDRDDYWYSDASSLVNEAFERYKEYYSYMLMEHAVDRKLRTEYEDIFMEQTAPFLNAMRERLWPYSYRNKANATDYQIGHNLLFNCGIVFENIHTAEIEQLRYNTSKLYPVARERKKQKLESNFKKWFSEQALGMVSDISNGPSASE